MRIRLVRGVGLGGDRTAAPGDVLDLEDGVARGLIMSNKAVACDDDAVARPLTVSHDDPVVEQRDPPSRRRR